MTVRPPGATPGTKTGQSADTRTSRVEAEAALLAWHQAQRQPGHHGDAARHAASLLACVADNAADYSNLGVLWRSAGEPARAEAAYRQAIALDPGFAAASYNLGNLLLDAARPAEAEPAFRAAIASRATYGEAWNGLGLALQRLGSPRPAAEAFAAAVRLAPNWAEAHVNLGVGLFALEDYEAAHQAYETALRLQPDHVAAHGNLGALLLRAGHAIAAEAACRRAIAISPDEHRWHANLAVALQMQARHQDAEASYRQALRLRPDYAGGHGTLLFALNYRDDLSPEAIFAEYQRWDATHARALPRLPERARSSSGLLRVGYVSPDFRAHAVALFAEPLLAAHDRTRVELFLYAEVTVEDATTARFRALADHWRPTLGLSDQAMAAMIRDDEIDVLVDLGGHTAGSRLMVFARRPAPVQVAYLLGHGYTSGLSAMDLFLADSALVPQGADVLFAERVVRLDRIPIAYQPPADMPAIIRRDPARPLTFGHFGRTERLNNAVIATWARILRDVPGSRLILDNRPFQEPSFRALFAGRFAEQGIEAERVVMRYTTPQQALWAAYGDIDLALDPFPHNAGTTTIEALWMGVPVLSLAARPSVGRFGAAILGALGLDDWVAGDVDAYVARAVAAASDRVALAELSAGLRDRFRASPLFDARDLARKLEDVFATAEPRATVVTSAASHPGTDTDTPRLLALFGTDSNAAARLADAILARSPDHPVANHVAGLIAYQQTRYADADAHLTRTRAALPDDPEAHANHAAILRKLGRLTDAEAAARAALALSPDRAATHNNLGNILRDAGRFEDATIAFRDAVRLQPDFADAWANLSWVQSLCGQALESERSARQAIALDPDNANGHNNLGLALMRQSRLGEAEDALREALARKPDFVMAHSNILFCLNYRDDWTAEDIFAEYQRWDAAHARALRPAEDRHDLDLTQGRRLRVGYVSPDFRTHAVALFSEPLLAEHDRSRFELFLYAELAQGDATTERFRALADHWRPTIGLDDQAVAEMIRRDRIDILVDLAGHTAGNRLLVFARRPAPVQIAFMLGHGYTSGLSAIDAFLADEALAPTGSEHLFSERVVRLPHIPLAYRPPAGMPDVAPAPVTRNGFITFGYFGRTVRLNDRVIATWAAILRAVPNARLMLNNGPFAEAAGRDLMRARFASHGIPPDRLILTCTAPQPVTWAAYGEIDIALDPFPHNAGTTTIEALWMGVPVLTLAGRPTVGRFGASILHAVGLDGWVAPDTDAYVRLAERWAADPDGLARLRATLRPRFAACPMHDATGVARSIEGAFDTLWQEWRDRTASRSPRALFMAGDRAGAKAAADHCLALDPSHADALHITGLLAYTEGDARSAIAWFAKAPPRADILTDRGVLLRGLGRPDDAERCYRQALQLDPGFGPALGNLGNLVLDRGEAAAAETLFTRALATLPDQPWLLRGKALALLAREDAAGAEPLLRRALAIAPNDAEAHETLGALLSQTGRAVESEGHHRAALGGIRDRHRALGNLAVALQIQGRHAEAETCYREALALRPDYASNHGNLLFALNYRDDLSAEAIFAEYRAWDDRHGAVPPLHQPAMIRSRGDRLRVGYVSPDFRQHAVAHFALPMLAAHDRTRVELFLYPELAVADATTERFRTLAEHWRPTHGMTDQAVAEMIRADGIDVLVDMAGHTGGNRLLAFARRPAPVQIESLLGLGTTTGMRAMDVFLADANLAPPGAEALFAEQVIRLSRIPLAYAPPSGMPPVLPRRDGSPVFGYFGRVQRLNPRVIAAWARILRAVPDGRLMLNSQPFLEPAFRDLYRARFAEHGITADRLDLVYTTPQATTWAAYQAIDVALDPFPHNAGTTTIEALWMGVPVVTRADRPTVGRFGAAILGSIGLDDWVTADDDAYVARSVAAMDDRRALADLRASLRARVAASPLCDAAGLTREVEAVYRDLFEGAVATPALAAE